MTLASAPDERRCHARYMMRLQASRADFAGTVPGDFPQGGIPRRENIGAVWQSLLQYPRASQAT